MKVSVLMYADDLVLLSQTEDGLQRGINALHRFCTENNLTVNTSKGKLNNIQFISDESSAELVIYLCE